MCDSVESRADSKKASNTNGQPPEASPEATPDPHATPSVNSPLPNGKSKDLSKDDEAAEAQPVDDVFNLKIKLPHTPGETSLMVSTQEQVQDIRQSIVDLPFTFQYSCFHLEHKGKRINDFVELSEVPGIVEEPECLLKEDPYTENQARMHFVRVRELVGASGDRVDVIGGIGAGLSLYDGVELPPADSGKSGRDSGSPIDSYDLNSPASIQQLLPKTRVAPPKTVKHLSVSPWNPPPHHLRSQGHLLYLQVITNEGEQHQITSSITGFYVNKTTKQKFDPSPRQSPKAFTAHSLLTLLSQISPSFESSFESLQEYNGARDPLASYALSNALPATPWLVPLPSQTQHQSDHARSQEPLLLSAADETLRDWNEEFQSTRELPKASVQDRVFRERLTSKLFAEYNEQAVRGAILVARGEVQALNPTEARDAQIFVSGNVFYSFGADGVGTFATEGGDEAARAAVGKDVTGVRAVNQLDINGLFTPGTVVVDYLGKRIVCQSIVPGIFKQRDEGEHQIDYGGVEGKDVIANHEAFTKPFEELSKALRVKKHTVWDKEGKGHVLEGSVETKGLLGTDGRKYVLDLYRVTPLDITWLEQHRIEPDPDGKAPEDNYPHRMAVLRPELVEIYWRMKLREFVGEEVKKRAASRADGQANGTGIEEKVLANGEAEKGGDSHLTNGESTDTQVAKLSERDSEPRKDVDPDRVDVSNFYFSLNPDVFSGQKPETEEAQAEYEKDEVEVRNVCKYLTSDLIPGMLKDLQEGDVGFPMDGQSLSTLLHKRGINVRYLGDIAQKAQGNDRRLDALKGLCVLDMVARSFKHVVNRYLRALPPVFSQLCVAHLLNCLVGAALNSKPSVEVYEEVKVFYPEAEFGFEDLTPETLREEIKRQVKIRYRYDLEGELVQLGKELQMLREVSLRLGLQLEAKEYAFGKDSVVMGKTLEARSSSDSLSVPQNNGVHPLAEGAKKRKKRAAHAEHSPNRAASASSPTDPPTTFHPDNILNIAPIVKEASPRSVLAEEALDAGRMSISQGQKELGEELLVESLSLHEQIYGILHPEVARVYYALSTLFYGLDKKESAVELARKAVIVSERTLGVDHAETVLGYLNLSLFEHAMGHSRNALAFVRHALELWKVTYGTRHPDSITTLNNVAVMLQGLKMYKKSRRWFEASLVVCEEVSGKSSINTATLLFQLAQALALDGDPKAAVSRMRDSYSIFKTTLGPENQNTKEAETWLESLTHSAVNVAKQANALQNRRLLLTRRPGGGLAMRTRPQPQPLVGQSSADAVGPQRNRSSTAGLDKRSVEELLRYINGEAIGKPSTPKKKQTNPKRRPQRAAP